MRTRHRSPLCFAVAIVGATLAFAAEAKPGASGTVTINGATWPVADAIAYVGDDELKVVLSQTPFDRGEFAKNGKIDDFDILGHDGDTVTLRIDADGKSGCLNYASGGGGGSSCSSDYDDALKLTTRDAKRVAGSFAFPGESAASTVTFDLPIESTLARPGTALPADGGEPGAAAHAHFAAIAAGDFEKLKAVSHPERVAQMQQAEKEGQAKEMFAFLQQLAPKNVKIAGGTVDGDNAVLDFTGEEGGQPVKGTVELERFQGKWYVAGTSTGG